MTGSKRRSARVAASNSRSVYAELDTEDDFGGNSSGSARPPVVSRRHRRAATAGPSNYVEPATDDEFELVEVQESRVSGRRRPASKSRKTTSKRKQLTRSNISNKRPRTTVARPRNEIRQALSDWTPEQFSGPSDCRIPAWTTLPVNILKDVFAFAIRLKKEPNGKVSVKVMANAYAATRTCRKFVQPALEAYYESLELYDPLQPHLLLAQLRSLSDTRLLNYNVKIKCLYIDVAALSRVARHHSLFNLSTLVKVLPQLQDCQVFSPKHSWPYRQKARTYRWTFPMASLIRTMSEADIKLKSWRWSREMIDKEHFSSRYGTMTAAHTSKPFERLERLLIYDFNFDDSVEARIPDGAESHVTDEQPPQLAAVIALLPNLKDLTFTSCDMVMDKFLQYIPCNLQRLELTNCLEITSDLLCDYFRSSGSQLRTAVFNHNSALTLSFLTSLKELCPRLEVLSMDLKCVSERENTDDSEPLYDELLAVSEIPQWPSGLQRLELLDAKKLCAGAAEHLFRSLIENASELADLRYLEIKAHIDIPWRDRAVLKAQWIERLERVFKRPRAKPASHLGSLKEFRLWKQALTTSDHCQQSDVDELSISSDDDKIYFRHLMAELQCSPQVLVKTTHTPEYAQNGTAVHVSTGHRSIEPRRSKRVADSQASQMSTGELSGSNTGSEDSDEDDGRKQPEEFVQGLCDVVEITIDNQRPRENLFTNEDFADSEQSGDEDWEEDAEDDEDDGYAS